MNTRMAIKNWKLTRAFLRKIFSLTPFNLPFTDSTVLAEDRTIRNEIAATKGVMQATVTFSIPNRNTSGSPGFYKAGDEPSNVVEPYGIVADEKYAETFGIALIAGSFFSKANTLLNDSSGIVVNETFVKALGWKSGNEAVGMESV